MGGIPLGNQFLIGLAMFCYICVILGVGLYYARRAHGSSEAYFIGGRGMGPWVTAMSAEASDMSGWLLMGLPGIAYWSGLADAFWTALGLGIGTYANWLITARRLRIYSHVAGDAITLPDFLSNRFHEEKRTLMTVAATLILVFFTVYAASGLVTIGKLFSYLFATSYFPMMILGAIFVVSFTIIGGYLAEATSDLIQATLMIFALVFVLEIGIHQAGGIGQVIENAKTIPGFFEFFGIAQPVVSDGMQVVNNGIPAFESNAKIYTWLSVISTLSWGLGYFGVPQVLIRFMAIRDSKEIAISRRIATIWVFISLFAAVAIGIIGRGLYPSAHLSASSAENIFITITTSLVPSFLAGIVMAGILAATFSSCAAFLLIAASAIAKNIYQKLLKKEATDKQVMNISRIMLFVIAIVAIFFAADENSVIFNIVSFAWAGFGSAFGPIIILSLFWKGITRNGALAGMITGGLAVFIWNYLEKQIGGIFTLYELLPAFLLSLAMIVIVSLIDKTYDERIIKDFEEYQRQVKL